MPARPPGGGEAWHPARVSNRGKVRLYRVAGALLLATLAVRGVLLLREGGEPQELGWVGLAAGGIVVVADLATRRARREEEERIAGEHDATETAAARDGGLW